MYTIPEKNVFKTKRDPEFIENAGIDLKLALILVPGGTFYMGGQDNEIRDNEKPVHPVTLKSFYMGKYPITQAQYKLVMNNNPSERKDDKCPVTNVNWNEAQDFCQQLSKLTGKTYRLPTEAEWEYAAQGGQKLHLPKEQQNRFKYAGSSSVDEVAWYSSNHNSGVRQVGQKKPNELGIHDMSGNVWEWCQDWYDSAYYKNSPSINPQGPASGSDRLLRGGSWGNGAVSCRVAYRSNDPPTDRNINCGFRVALVP